MNKHTHLRSRTAIIRLALVATLIAGGGYAGADESKGDVFFPWKAHGKVYEVAPKTLMFVGELKGILYAESAKGPLDAASMICPMLYEIDVEAGNARSEGRCAISPKEGGGTIYATYSCHGRIGSCAGRFDLTGGTGRYEASSGSGAMTSRTGASELAMLLGAGGDISHAEGLMTLDGFGCKTP